MTIEEDDVLARTTLLLHEFPPETVSAEEFLGAQFDAGLAWVQFDRESGGLGYSAHLQRVVEERLGAANAPHGMAINPVGYGHGAGVVYSHGTTEQRRRWLRPLFACSEIWCQLFSEPGAGSDLAGLSTSAVRDGDEWVVTGQKVWSSGAVNSRWGLLLARTDPGVPKHRGLTFFIIDMQSPGVEVRPIREMTGGTHFNETFLSDVRIPDAYRIGEVGMGWSVAVTTLMYERVLVSDATSDKSIIEPLIDQWNEIRLAGDPPHVLRDRVVNAWIQVRVTELLNERSKQLRATGEPGAEGSLGKLAHTRVLVETARLALDLQGPAGLVGYDYLPGGADFGTVRPATVQGRFILSPSHTIEGGTSEINLNVIGERMLGLPSEPRADKDRPWSEVPRS